jgi:predicted PurR-regulated permease PerM
MKKKDKLRNSGGLNNSSFALIVFSIGATLGALIALVLSRLNQVKSSFRRVQLPSQAVLEIGPDSTELNTFKTVSPAGFQSGIAVNSSFATVNAGAISPGRKTTNHAKQDDSLAIPGASPTVIPDSDPLRKKATAIPVNPGQASVSKRWSTPTRYIMGVFLFLALLVVLWIGRSAIPIVVAAALLALFVDPLVVFFNRRFKFKKGLSVALTYLLVIGLLLLIPLLALPSLVNAINFVLHFDTQLFFKRLGEVIQSVSTAIQTNPTLTAFVQPILDSLSTKINDWASAAQAGTATFNLSVEELASRFGQALGSISKILGPTISFLASLLFTLLISLQMTLTADGMKSWFADLIPTGYGPEIAMMVQKIRRTWVGFLRGQMSLMLLIGGVTWLGATILGLPQALFLGVIAGVMELIPNIGPTLAAIPAVLLALLVGSTYLPVSNLVFALIVVGFYVLVQLVENQLIVPRLMGDAVDLPPLVVLIGTIAGAGAFGILGALLATPVIATGNLVFRYIYRKILEDQPEPPPVEEKPGIMDSIRGFLSRLRLPSVRGRQPDPAQPSQEKQ